MCCRHSLAGSKQGKSRGCSRSGSKQQRRQERHFLVPTAAPAPGAPRPSARPARLDGRLESAARPAAAEEPHRLEPGRRRAGKKLHGCWWVSFSAINAQFWSSARKLIVTQTQTQATFPPRRQIKLAV